MRGLFSYIDAQERIPAKDPLRQVHRLVCKILGEMDPEFQRLYSH